MYKTLFYLPAILFTFLYGWLAMIFGFSSLSPIIFLWIALFVLGGFLLSKGRYWGGFFGMLPGIHLMYMSTRDTGQVIHIELPLGLTVVIFYIICSSFIIYKRRKKQN